MSDLDEEMAQYMELIVQGTDDLPENEQSLVKAWMTKIVDNRQTDEEKKIRNEYAQALANLVAVEKILLPPFTKPPYTERLIPFLDLPDSAFVSEGTSVNKGEAVSEAGGPTGADGNEKDDTGTEDIEGEAQDTVRRASTVPGGSHDRAEDDGHRPQYTLKKMPCADGKNTGANTGAIPKTRKVTRRPLSFDSYQYFNEYEDLEEMAKVVARSKGQPFAEFVASISRHTRDFGQGLRLAMKAETTSFKEYVDNVLAQRLKDLTDVLDEEQNRELQGIKKDTERWQMELCNVKKRIKEMVPNFDLALYRKDKNYIKKLFTINNTGTVTEDDSFRRYKEESSDRLKWINEMTYDITNCNEQARRDLTDFQTRTAEFQSKEEIKQENMMGYLNCEIDVYRRLKAERDQLFKENNELLKQLDQ